MNKLAIHTNDCTPKSKDLSSRCMNESNVIDQCEHKLRQLYLSCSACRRTSNLPGCLDRMKFICIHAIVVSHIVAAFCCRRPVRVETGLRAGGAAVTRGGARAASRSTSRRLAGRPCRGRRDDDARRPAVQAVSTGRQEGKPQPR